MGQIWVHLKIQAQLIETLAARRERKTFQMGSTSPCFQIVWVALCQKIRPKKMAPEKPLEISILAETKIFVKLKIEKL